MTSRRRHRVDPGFFEPPDAAAITALVEKTDEPELREQFRLLAALATQVERLGNVRDAALDLLTPEEFVSLVWRSPNPARTHFLCDLYLPSAKRPTLTAAGHGLARIRAWPPDLRARAAAFLAGPTVSALTGPLDAWCRDQDDDALRRALEDDPRPNAVRLAVLTSWDIGADYTAALRIVLTGRLALPTWPADVVADVADACLARERWSQRTAPASPGPGIEERQAHRSAPAGGPGGPECGRMDGGHRVNEAEAPARGPVGEVADELVAAAGLVGARLAAARAAVRQAAAELDAARLPGPGTWERVGELADAAERGRALLGFPAEEAADCEALMAALTRAAEARRRAAEARAADVDRLRPLLRLAGPASHEGAVGGLRDLARALLAADPWDEAQQRRVDGLRALGYVIEAIRAGDVGEAVAQAQAARRDLAGEPGALVDFALAGSLSVATAAEPAAPSPELADEPAAPGAATLAPGEETGADDGPPAAPEAGEAEPVDAESADGTSVDGESVDGKSVDGGSDIATPVETAVADTDPPGAMSSEAHGPDAAAQSDDEPAGTDRSDDARGESRETGGTPQDRAREERAHEEEEEKEIAAGRELLAELLPDRRTGLADHAATALDRACGTDAYRPLADALRVLALADAARRETGPTAVALRAALAEWDQSRCVGRRSAQLVLLAASVRAALVAADPHAGEIARHLAGGLPELPDTAAIADAMGTEAAHGSLAGGDMLAALAPIVGADHEIDTAVAEATRERDRLRTLQFQRANVLIDRWWARGGLIGALLDSAANDRRADVRAVAGEVRRLTKHESLTKELRATDNDLRGPGSRALEGAARRRLLEYARESVDVVGAWVDAVRAGAGPAVGGQAVPARLAALRTRVSGLWVAAAAELRDLASTSDDRVLAACALACATSLEGSVGLLVDARHLPGIEPEPAAALNGDLLRCPALPMDAAAVPLRPVALADVRIAAATGWDEAFRARLAAEDYVAARCVVELIPDQTGERPTTMSEDLERAAARSRGALRVLRDKVTADVERAARLGQLNDAARSEVIGRLEPADPERDDLGRVRRLLDGIAESLPEYAAQAKSSLQARVAAELNATAGPEAEQVAKTIRARIEVGDLATAEEYLLMALDGAEIPSREPVGDLARFLAVPGTLPDGIGPRLVAAARHGDAVPGLDFAALSADECATAANGLQAWLELRADKTRSQDRTVLGRALRLAGIAFQRTAETDVRFRDPQLKWIDLIGVRRVGQAILPAFGSGAGDRLRLLLCWSVPDVKTLLAWVAQDRSDRPVLVAMFRTLPLARRRALAKACAERREKSVIVLDDAALAYVAAYGHGRFATTERILMPFAAANPYHPDVAGAVPEEMFYGRRAERKQILDPQGGTSLLYGGRQLGKSALLHAVRRDFERTEHRVAIYLSLGRGIGELWDKIADALTTRGISLPRRGARVGAKQIAAAVTGWLAEHPEHKILLLLDECDDFFDADADTGFRQTTDLRDLTAQTDRRFRPVFAGLHQVQRFAHLPNQPFAHFGTPIVIGPLTPDSAHQLVFTPMEALGIFFSTEALIHRVLAYCSYQPKLLQLVARALVEEVLERRGDDGPPYAVGEEELEQVIGSESLRRQVRETFDHTLNLDSRYKVIALVIAHAAYGSGVDHAQATTWLRRQCMEYWPGGFVGQRPDEFLSLLEEMTGLGILSGDRQEGWRLRSGNVLRLLGSEEEILDQLMLPEWQAMVTGLSAEQARGVMVDHSVAPVTERQLAALTERQNRLWVVIGTPATGVGRLRHYLEEAQQTSGRFALCLPDSAAAYRKALRRGEPGGLHRVVFCDLSQLRPERVREDLELARESLPPAGVTRSVVTTFDASVPGAFETLAGLGLLDESDQVMALSRVSADGLRSWVRAGEGLSRFSDVGIQGELMQVTGGWTVLVDRAAALAGIPGSNRSAQRVCQDLMKHLATPDGAASLVADAGLLGNPSLALAFRRMVEFEQLTYEELLEVFEAYVDGADSRRIASALRCLDLMVERPEDGLWLPEPVLAAAWQVTQQAEP